MRVISWMLLARLWLASPGSIRHFRLPQLVPGPLTQWPSFAVVLPQGTDQ